MMDMYKQEQCISNLEQQISWIEDIKAHQFPGWGHTVNAMRQAIALLKAQEPRVMTLEEAQSALYDNLVVYVELKDIMIAAGVRMDETDYFTMQNGDVLCVTDLDSKEAAEDYGTKVRCWTSRPTDEQREAVKWE